MPQSVQDLTPEQVEGLLELLKEKKERLETELQGYGDENTRALTEGLQITIQKLRRTLANVSNYIASLEAYASGLAELPVDVDNLVDLRILAEVTLDDRFQRAVQKLGGARSWGAWLGKHIGLVVGLIVLGSVSSLAIYRLTEPENFNALIAATSNINWWQAGVIVGAVAISLVIAFLAWRQHKKQSQTKLGGAGLT